MTGYVVHYNDGVIERSLRLAAFTFHTNITQLGRNREYTLAIEATSIQLSGVSYTTNILVTDEGSPYGNSTASIRNDGDMVVTIAAAVAATAFFTAVAGVFIATVVWTKRKSSKPSTVPTLANSGRNTPEYHAEKSTTTKTENRYYTRLCAYFLFTIPVLQSQERRNGGHDNQ